MGFNTREVLREVCAFRGKGSECPPVKRSVGPTLPYNRFTLTSQLYRGDGSRRGKVCLEGGRLPSAISLAVLDFANV